MGRGRLAAATLAITLAAGGIAVASGAGTTEVSTIQDRHGDNRLEPAPGDDYLTRAELGPASPARTRTGEPLLTFGQLTDLHIVDEESPARVGSSTASGRRSPAPTARTRASRRRSPTTWCARWSTRSAPSRTARSSS
jgi:hypothetical protein